MSMSIDSMASMLNTTNTDATTNYNANALKKSLNGVSSDTSADELMQVCHDCSDDCTLIERDHKSNVMKAMRWTNEWVNSDGKYHEYLFLMEKC